MVFRRKVLNIKRSRPEPEKVADQQVNPTTDDTKVRDKESGVCDKTNAGNSTQRILPKYLPHLSAEEMQRCISEGKMMSGVLQTSRKNSFYGHIIVSLDAKDIVKLKASAHPFLKEKIAPFHSRVVVKVALPNAEAINRAFSGDTVCVEITPDETSEEEVMDTATPASEETEQMEAIINEEYENEANTFYETHQTEIPPIEKEVDSAMESEKSPKTHHESKESHEPYISIDGKVRGILAQGKRAFCGSLLGFVSPKIPAAGERKEEEKSVQDCQENLNDAPEPSTTELPLSMYANAYAFQNKGQDVTFASDNFFFFQPYNRAYPKMRIHLSRSILHSMPLHVLLRTRFMVRFTDWELTNTHPSANVLSVIGEEGNIEVEEKVILFESNMIDSVAVSTTDHNNYAKDEVQSIVEGYYRELSKFPKLEKDSKEPSLRELLTPFFSDSFTDEARRYDLQPLPIFSIDPQGCKDIDDALHCIPVDKEKFRQEIVENTDYTFSQEDRQLASNILEASEDIFYCGIHIADVSHYVQEDSKLDLEARRRGTSVYLVNKRINMLPSTLSEYLCSLQSNEERFCFSVTFFITSGGEILTAQKEKRTGVQSVAIDLSGIKIMKSIIRSSLEMSYEQAHEILMNEYGQTSEVTLVKDPSKITSSVRSGLVGLHRISVALRNTREMGGAVFLASPEFRFRFSDDENNFHPSQMLSSRTEESTPQGEISIDTHALIEEFMLLANSIVARTILASYPQHALLRNHLPPIMETTDSKASMNSMFELMNKELEKKRQRIVDRLHALGAEIPEIRLHIDVSSSKALNESLRHCHDPLDADFNRLLKLLVTRAMTRAHYIDSSSKDSTRHDAFLHYGLALPCYTHFTSPIRRYADLVVHRLLGSIFKYNSPPSFAEVCSLSAEETELSSMSDTAQAATAATIYGNLTMLATHLNTRHEKAQTAGRDSQKFFCKLYLLGLPNISRSRGKSSDDACCEKLVLSKMKGYIIRKGSSRVKAAVEGPQEIIVMVPDINLEGELIYPKEDCQNHDLENGEAKKQNSENTVFDLFEKLVVDVWIVTQPDLSKSSRSSGPQIELRLSA
ncbi:rrp44p-like protein [Perkinsela sp. CCAP 1560/4]|nr:rrp44p-like protein [Perkinsela sp. CCAP 1560/4]|eukprot:KNH06980.1 rrp44p-like protein [Perkinsela sp. CCAP 1560/4]